MRRHPEYAREMLLPIRYLGEALEVPIYHHERWDGTGYPRGLKGEEIPVGARIFAVVDVWDALTSDRPYREKWRPEDATEYLRANRGKQFDPQIVDAFPKLLGSEWRLD
jgi:HD-GYP domain-containing protein (c-di-GMP phosphodiesterase class II)